MAKFREAAERVLRFDRFADWSPKGNRERFARSLTAWRTQHPQLNVEEYFVLVELLANISHKEVEDQAIEPYREFRYLIAKTLLEATDGRNLGYLQTLLKKFDDERKAGHARHALVSLNWDSLPERFVASPFQWLTAERKVVELSPRAPMRATARSIPIYKPHGSLAWWWCRSCGHTAIDPEPTRLLRSHEKAAPILSLGLGVPCSSCQEPAVEPAFIPPTSQKLSNQSVAADLFKHVWRATQDRLLRCNTLNVVGYSFPSTDMQFRVLLQDCLKVGGNIERVNIVTNRKLGNARVEFEQQTTRFFDAIGLEEIVQIHDMGVANWSELGGAS